MSAVWEAEDGGAVAASVDAALRQRAWHVQRLAPSLWEVDIRTAELLVVVVEDSWLTIEAPALEEWTRMTASSLLRAAAEVPPPLRLVDPNESGVLRWRAELALEGDADVAPPLAAALAGFAAVERPGPVAPAAEPARSEIETNASSASLNDLCAGAGWAATSRPDGSLAVDLDVPGAYLQAILRASDDGDWSADVALVSGPPSSDVCSEACARLLLRVGGCIRFVQAALVAGGAGLEVSFAAPAEAAAARHELAPGLRVRGHTAATSADLGHAFAALSLACRQSAREAAIVWEDERVARLYLAPREALERPE